MSATPKHRFTFPLLWLFAILSFSISVTADPLDNLFGSNNNSLNNDFLPVDEAFQLDFNQQGDKLQLTWRIADGYYLYRDKIKLHAVSATLENPEYPKAVFVHDEAFGDTWVYYQQLSLEIPVSNNPNDSELTVTYMGCAEAGLCYPPTSKTLPLFSIANTLQPAISPVTTAPTTKTIDTPQQDSSYQSEQESLAGILASGEFISVLAVFFILGIGLAFTPCVFPMYPILTGIIAGREKSISASKGLFLSFIYVQGMAITYTLLGMLVAQFGVKFQAFFQHPAVLIGISLLFVFLAFSMFGNRYLTLPQAWQDKLNGLNNQQKGGTLSGVFFMGALSGLVASPCTTAPLSGALLYIANNGDYVLGGSALYALSLGMGVPLLVIGATGGKLLPKAGQWMNIVKHSFGFIMLCVPLIFLDRILPSEVIHALGAILLLSFATYLFYARQQIQSAAAKAVMQLLGTSGVTIACLIAWSLWQPIMNPSTAQNTSTNALLSTQATSNGKLATGQFITVASLAELNTLVAKAAAQDSPVMVDFYAEWCIACKEFEHNTFPDARVQTHFGKFVLVRIDVTEGNDADNELLDHFSINGLPSLLFFDTNQAELTQLRVMGFLTADEFAPHLENILKR